MARPSTKITHQQILEALEANGAATVQTVTRLLRQRGIKCQDDVARYLLNEMFRDGSIVRLGRGVNGDPYRYDVAG